MELKIKLDKKIFSANIENEHELNSLINKLLMFNGKKYPFFINLLVTLCDIEKPSEENKNSLAYTYSDYLTERIKIVINWEKVIEYNFNSDEILFLIFHELLHNYFYHFTRMKEESKISPELSNIITDYYCNTLLFEMLNISFKNFEKKGINIVTYETLKKIAKKQLPFDNFNDAPVEPALFKWFLNKCPNIFKESEEFISDGQVIDNHEMSEKIKQKAVEKYNKNKQDKNPIAPTLSEQDLDILMSSKILNIEKEIEESNNASSLEKDLIRYKEKITKKNDFLNLLDLKKIISKELAQHYLKTYKRASRTRQSDKVVFKGKTKEFGKKILLAIDVSGSISDEELKQCYEMINGFLDKNKNNTVLDVVYWSSCKITEKHFHKNIKDIKELIKYKVHSSGGTEINYLHDWINEYYKNQYIGVINVTDGWFYSESNIPKPIIQYDFVLTEKDREEDIKKEFNDKRVKTHTIKKAG